MKKIRKALTAVVVFSMIASYVYVPIVQAASLTNVTDLVSTSAPSTSANHSFTFDTAVVLDSGGYIQVQFNTSYGTIGTAATDVTCPGGGTATGDGTYIVTCTYSSGLATSTGKNLVVNSITNPTTGFYDVEVRTYLNNGTLQESAKVINAIVDTVTVTAHVDSTLTFNVVGINSSQTVNGDTTTGTSTATTTPFGNLTPGTQYIVGQQLEVTTNASAGFQVTVTQNSDFSTAAGAKIDSFIDGSATTTPNSWVSPAGTLTDNTTWGHLGFTTDDNDSTSFGASQYAGLTVGTPFTIMGHTGPSSATQADAGLTKVAYSVEINALQEAGDYETTLTYIATPTY